MFKNILTTVSILFFQTNFIFSSLSLAELDFAGDITSYGAMPENQFCGFKKNSWNYRELLTGAINIEQIDNSLTCGLCAMVEYKDKKEVILIDNLCPECKKGDIDLSHQAWKKIVGDENYSRYKAKWSFVDCEKFIMKDKGIILKPYSINYWWLSITPSNMKCGVSNMEIKFKHSEDKWITMERDNNKMNGLYFIYHAEVKPPFKFKLTSRIGDVVETDWYNEIGDVWDLGVQFDCNSEEECGFQSKEEIKNKNVEEKSDCKCRNLRSR